MLFYLMRILDNSGRILAFTFGGALILAMIGAAFL